MIVSICFIALALFGIVLMCQVIAEEKKARGEEEFLLNRIVELATNVAELDARVQTLETNTESPELRKEDEPAKNDAESRANQLYNEGMDNIFGYTVNTGIKVGESNE